MLPYLKGGVPTSITGEREDERGEASREREKVVPLQGGALSETARHYGERGRVEQIC